MTGAHIAYALAMRLRKERMAKKADCRACVMYCGPSQQSVNVVMGKKIIHQNNTTLVH